MMFCIYIRRNLQKIGKDMANFVRKITLKLVINLRTLFGYEQLG